MAKTCFLWSRSPAAVDERYGSILLSPPQAFRVLELLASHPGQLVSREEIQKQVWTGGTFVDFEHGINKSIRQIRYALRDDADAPKFIETLPRRGYRFIAELTVSADAQDSPASEIAIPVRQDGEAAAGLGLPSSATPAKKVRFWSACAIALAGLTVVAWRVASRPRFPTEPVWNVEPLTTFPGAEVFPAFSPDAKKVVFVWTGDPPVHPDIYVKTIGQSDVTRLTDDEATECYPAWSPDGKWIAFEHCNPGGIEGYIATTASVNVIPAKGGEKRKAGEVRTPTDRYLPQLAWTPDSQWLILRNREPASDRVGLFLLSPFTGQQRQITSPPAANWDDATPAVSPDGRFLAFTRSASPQVRDVYLLPLAGDYTAAAAPRRLTSAREDITGIFWVEGGKELLYFSRGPTPFLWQIGSLKGGTPHRLPAPDTFSNHLNASPDGRLLVYTNGYSDTDVWRIAVPGASISAAARLISSTRSDLAPASSPDGAKIVFASDRTGAMEIWASAADGSAPVQLTHYGAESGSPRWSPDGTAIAFDATIQGNADIYVISSTGGEPRRLTTDATDERVPTWSRDGKTIYFTSNRTGRLEIWKTPAEGGQATQVTHNGGFMGFESADGKYFYYARRSIRPYSVYRLPLAGGEEKRVIETIKGWLTFAVVPDGIYFVPDSAPHTLHFYDFATEQNRVLGDLAKDIGMGFSFSPDRKSLLVAPTEFRNGDLFLASRGAMR